MSRGYNNNNPLNIRLGTSKPWRGEIRPSRDRSFAQFETMGYGFRAAFKLLDNYRKNGCVSLEDFISRWAPPSENNTRAYINAVTRRSGVADVQTLDTRHQYTMKKVVRAMAFVENGADPSQEDIDEGWRLWQLYP